VSLKKTNKIGALWLLVYRCGKSKSDHRKTV